MRMVGAAVVVLLAATSVGCKPTCKEGAPLLLVKVDLSSIQPSNVGALEATLETESATWQRIYSDADQLFGANTSFSVGVEELGSAPGTVRVSVRALEGGTGEVLGEDQASLALGQDACNEVSLRLRMAGSADAGTSADGGSPDVFVSQCPGLEPLSDSPGVVYVASDGDDDAAGTSTTPLRSLARAARRLSGGGTVIVRGGLYPTQSNIAAEGAAGRPLVIRAAPGERPIFDGTGTVGEWEGVISFGSARHLVIDGLEVQNSLHPAKNSYGIRALTRVEDVTVRSCYVHHVMSGAIAFTGDDITIEDNVGHDIALQNENLTGDMSSVCLGTYLDRDRPADPWSSLVVVRRNRLERCWGAGIAVLYGHDVVIEDNHIETVHIGVFLDSVFTALVRRNFIHMTEGGGIMWTSMAFNPATTGSVVHHVDLINNVLDAPLGFGWWASNSQAQFNSFHDIRILHNTAITAGGAYRAEPVPSGASPPSGCVIANNVFAPGAVTHEIAHASGYVIEGNVWLNASERPPGAGPTDAVATGTVGTVRTGTDAAALASWVGTSSAVTGAETDFACRARSTTRPTRGAFER